MAVLKLSPSSEKVFVGFAGVYWDLPGFVRVCEDLRGFAIVI